MHISPVCAQTVPVLDPDRIQDRFWRRLKSPCGTPGRFPGIAGAWGGDGRMQQSPSYPPVFIPYAFLNDYRPAPCKYRSAWLPQYSGSRLHFFGIDNRRTEYPGDIRQCCDLNLIALIWTPRHSESDRRIFQRSHRDIAVKWFG